MGRVDREHRAGGGRAVDPGAASLGRRHRAHRRALPRRGGRAAALHDLAARRDGGAGAAGLQLAVPVAARRGRRRLRPLRARVHRFGRSFRTADDLQGRYGAFEDVVLARPTSSSSVPRPGAAGRTAATSPSPCSPASRSCSRLGVGVCGMSDLHTFTPRPSRGSPRRTGCWCSSTRARSCSAPGRGWRSSRRPCSGWSSTCSRPVQRERNAPSRSEPSPGKTVLAVTPHRRSRTSANTVR